MRTVEGRNAASTSGTCGSNEIDTGSIARHGPAAICSHACHATFRNARGGVSVFTRELTVLKEAGYTRVGDYLVPPR